uniref:Uncharacterized protein n=1 Tax=Glossina morsitans morsitans TaxID=37546 RepID=A0ABK9NGN6_GLOMM
MYFFGLIFDFISILSLIKGINKKKTRNNVIIGQGCHYISYATSLNVVAPSIW